MPIVRACFGAGHFKSAGTSEEHVKHVLLEELIIRLLNFGEAPALRWLQGLAAITLLSVPGP